MSHKPTGEKNEGDGWSIRRQEELEQGLKARTHSQVNDVMRIKTEVPSSQGDATQRIPITASWGSEDRHAPLWPSF